MACRLSTWGCWTRREKKIKANVASLSEVVRQGYKIVVPRRELQLHAQAGLPAHAAHRRHEDWSRRTPWTCRRYLVKVHESGKLDLNFSEEIGKIRYHQPCHLKAQDIGFKAQELMQLIPDSEVSRMQCCSGHDGSWSVRKENFEASMQVGRAAVQVHAARGRLYDHRLSVVGNPG